MAAPAPTPRADRGRVPRLLPIYIAAGAIFATLSARGFLIPLRASDIGADRFQIGLLFSIATLSSAVVSLPAGAISDRIGRKRTLVISVVVGAASQIGLAFSGTILLFYFWQVLIGVAAAAAQATLFAAVADAAPGSRLGRALGWVTLAFQVGFLSGPAIAGLLRHFLDVQQDILAMTALYAIALAMALIGVGQAQVRSANGQRFRAGTLEVIRSPRFVPAAMGVFTTTLLWGTLQAYLTIFSRQSLSLPDTSIGYLLALQALANGVARVPAGWLADRWERRSWLVAGCILTFAVSLLVLPHLHGFWQAAVLLVAAAPLIATANVSLSVAFSRLGTPASRGVAMGQYGTFLFVGLGVGPAVFGPLMQSYGYVTGFSAAAGVGVGLVVAGLALGLRTERATEAKGVAAPAG